MIKGPRLYVLVALLLVAAATAARGQGPTAIECRPLGVVLTAAGPKLGLFCLAPMPEAPAEPEAREIPVMSPTSGVLSWIDEAGTRFYTDDPKRVPERYTATFRTWDEVRAAVAERWTWVR